MAWSWFLGLFFCRHRLPDLTGYHQSQTPESIESTFDQIRKQAKPHQESLLHRNKYTNEYLTGPVRSGLVCIWHLASAHARRIVSNRLASPSLSSVPAASYGLPSLFHSLIPAPPAGGQSANPIPSPFPGRQSPFSLFRLQSHLGHRDRDPQQPQPALCYCLQQVALSLAHRGLPVVCRPPRCISVFCPASGRVNQPTG